MATSTDLASETSERELVITRIFDAPRELVFKAWTEPERQAQWLGPRGFSATIERAGRAVGDGYRYYMRDPEGGDHWQQGEVREMLPPERLVFTSYWTDAQEHPTTAETLITLTFEDVGGGKTRLTLRQIHFESDNARDLHRGGWNSSFDCLAEYLASAR